ncbi:MAG: hypothetical protein UV36_C0003G0006 [Parcubacteria group bacterium GW2011_GWC2_42_6]|nr:MAG: hypothetical protein UU87_C0003G0062 [Parcubacteria group bacterium GW2011_GWA2_42_11]KKS68035.1 MAG: hypothetical protein UV36_C0003G0006 [Parcubacteria group bacterium GW2011_GWC2_42_6]
MSGHSKWSQIKHKKALTDAKRGKLFSKLARQITIAAREKGGDPSANITLRMLIDKARSLNMPADNVDRAIKRGTGEIAGVRLENFLIEAYGPVGTALIIEGTTDSKNRTISEIKFLLGEHHGKMAEGGAVAWLFEHVGIINIALADNKINQDDLELWAIEAGAQDLNWLDNENLEIYTAPEKLNEIKKTLEDGQISASWRVSEASLGWRPKNAIPPPDDKIQTQIEKLFEALDEHDDVNEIYSNISNS